MNCYRFCCTILTDNAALIVAVFAARLIAENAALLFTDHRYFKLCKKAGNDRLTIACRRALGYGIYNYKTIQSIP